MSDRDRETRRDFDATLAVIAVESALPMPHWYVYILECRDGSLYTGIATDVDRRYAQHLAGKGARYTRSHPPLRVAARFEHPDRAAASRAEHAIKQLSASRKRALCIEPLARTA